MSNRTEAAQRKLRQLSPGDYRHCACSRLYTPGGHESKPLTIIRLETAVVEGDFDLAFTHVEIDETITDLGECFFAPGPPPF
jgi:hypothetical protein